MKKNLEARTWLAITITSASIIGISWLSYLSIENKADPKEILNLILPLFGTWVGTVLAFYFGRDNYMAGSQSAMAGSESAERLLTKEERLRSIQVESVMSKKLFKFDNLKEKVEEIFNQLKGKESKRYLPILNASGVLEALLYKDSIMLYLYELDPADRPAKTLADLLEEKPELKQDVVFVKVKGTLAEAKQKLDEKYNCKVVLVTENGDEKEPVLGLLTSTDIAQYAKA